MAAIAPNQTPAYEFGAFQLIPAEHQLLHQGVPVPLPPKAFETLVVLVEKSGHLVEKEELMRTLWPDSFVEEANLTHHIWTLRKALGEGENGTRYIETVPRRGYRFVADVRQSAVASSKDEGGFPRPRLVQTAPQATADDLGASTTMSGADQRGALDKSWTARGYLKLTAFALAGVLVGSAIAVYRYSHRPPNATEFESVAVTPFINESGKPELDYLADDLYESMISDLARMPRLSVFRYRGKSVEAKKVASDLSVQGVLNGRLVQHGENVTVYLTLVDGRTGREQTKEARLCAGGRRGTSGRSRRGTRGRGAEGGEGVGHYQRTRHELVQGGGAAAGGGGRRASGGRPDHPAAGEDPLQVRRRDRVAKRGHVDVA